MRARVLAVHRRPLVLEGIRAVLSADGDIDVIATTGGCAEAVDLYRIGRPDVALLAACLADGPAAEAIERIRAEFPDCRIAVLTGSDAQPDLRRVSRAGARAVLREDAEPRELLALVRLLCEGGRQLPAAPRRSLTLSPREREVLELLARGYRNRAIAAALGIGEETVKSHVKKIFDKLGVSDRSAAAAIAVRDGLVTLD
jgi:DNA-binding NarL/FixJ family response regulator